MLSVAPRSDRNHPGDLKLKGRHRKLARTVQEAESLLLVIPDCIGSQQHS